MEQEILKGELQFWRRRDDFRVVKGVRDSFYIRRVRMPEKDGPIHVVFRGHRMTVGLLSSKVTAIEDNVIPKYTYREYEPDEVLEVFVSVNAKDEEDVALALAEYFNKYPEDTEFEFVVPTERANRIFNIMRKNVRPKLMLNAEVFYDLGDVKIIV